jgi:hypothetical protein
MNSAGSQIIEKKCQEGLTRIFNWYMDFFLVENNSSKGEFDNGF